MRWRKMTTEYQLVPVEVQIQGSREQEEQQ
jgi:hypothetical protein